MRRFHSAFQPSNDTITEAIAFSVNCAFSSYDRSRFAINKAGQICLVTLHSFARIQSGVQCLSVIQVPHCACVD